MAAFCLDSYFLKVITDKNSVKVIRRKELLGCEHLCESVARSGPLNFSNLSVRINVGR